jgi:hypothetical protein
LRISWINKRLHSIKKQGATVKIITTVHKEKSNKMQQCIKMLLFHIFIKLNVFRATHRPSLGARTVLAASGFSYVEGGWTCSWWTLSGTLCLTTYKKPEAASAVLGS